MANDMFALTNSGLSAFLFSSVGAEPNGSDLTILSMLARLEKDPWAVAAGWARAPKATVIEELAESIARTPLCRPASDCARQTASVLVSLLPERPGTVQARPGPSQCQNPAAARPDRHLLLVSVAVGLILSLAMPWIMQGGQPAAMATQGQVAHQSMQGQVAHQSR